MSVLPRRVPGAFTGARRFALAAVAAAVAGLAVAAPRTAAGGSDGAPAPASAVSVPAAAAPSPVTVQADGRSPASWRALDAAAEARFQLGHAVYNTSWLPAGHDTGRRGGLGPLFNSVSCDACHNSRRRGRGPQGEGRVPTDFVVQAGRRLADGGFSRGHPRFGQVVNTDAIEGFSPEAEIRVRYRQRRHARPDGSHVTLHVPDYVLRLPDGGAPPDDLVVMPRMASLSQGTGLLEAIPEDAVVAAAAGGGTPSWVDAGDGRRLGRFGWQATEASVASQVAVAFAREMGLDNPLIDAIDCAPGDAACRAAPTGGSPEVPAELFAAVVAFQEDEAVRRTPDAARHLAADAERARLFAGAGCGGCHRSGWTTRDGLRIDPWTDLLLHDLSPALADSDVHGAPVHSLWRTAPLWGMSTALEGGRPVRLLHDGRARSVEEAIAWHDGAAAAARARFDALDAGQRQQLIDWVSAL